MPQDDPQLHHTIPSPSLPEGRLAAPSVRMALAARSTPTSPTLVRRASNSQTNPGEIVGIVAGVTAFFFLLLAMVQYRALKALFARIMTRLRRRGLDTPAEDRVWDVLSSWGPSAVTSTVASTTDLYVVREPRMRDLSVHLVSTADTARLPPLEPNRRPPSMFDPALVVSPPAPSPPLSRLEPLRRKPSTTLAPSSRESPPPPIPPKEPELEKHIATTPMLAAPKPVRGADLRPLSAYTSASTALSDMSLLKPNTRLASAGSQDKDMRLSRVLTVANPDRGFLPPIPPVPPIPPIFLQTKPEPRPLPTTSPRPEA